MADFLSEIEKKEIATAIETAERNTTGEIRVYLEKHCKEDPLTHAQKIFLKLKMNETEHRSGVLLYIAYADRALAITGDKGIHEKVPENFWDETKEMMQNYFSEGKFAEGIKSAVLMCGTQLHTHFPPGSVNPNELSNEVIFGEE